MADWREHVWAVPAPEYAQPNVQHAQLSGDVVAAINGMRNYGSCNLFHMGAEAGRAHCLSYSHPRPAAGTSWTAEDEYTVEMWRDQCRGYSVDKVQRRAGRPEGMLYHRDFLALMGFAADALAAELGVTLAGYYDLCACGPIRPEHRTSDLHEIAAHCGCSVQALAQVTLP